MDILFKIRSVYEIANEKETINQIIRDLNINLGIKITNTKRITMGQNINYKLYSNSNKKSYLLRIISRKGYPSVDNLNITYQLLESKKYKLIYHSKNTIVPYGYFIQEWIDGETYTKDDWLKYFTNELQKVHRIKTTYFGYHNGLNYKNIKDYFYNLDKIIDNSFGDIFIDDFSIWDLDKYNLTSNNFLSNTFNRIKTLTNKITSNVESVLLHGDMLPGNLIKNNNSFSLIDWDESRSGWWVYDIARTLYYEYIDLEKFLEQYKTNTPITDIEIGIKLEHIRQLLRTMCIKAFNTTDKDEVRSKIKEVEKLINLKFEQKIKGI